MVVLRVHPVHVYFERARKAEAAGALAEAPFWLEEILAACPCIPEVPDQLASVRARLRLPARRESLEPCYAVQLAGDFGRGIPAHVAGEAALPVRAQ